MSEEGEKLSGQRETWALGLSISFFLGPPCTTSDSGLPSARPNNRIWLLSSSLGRQKVLVSVFIRKWLAKITTTTKIPLAFGHLKAWGKKRKQSESFQNNKSKVFAASSSLFMNFLRGQPLHLPPAGWGCALDIKVNTEF